MNRFRETAIYPVNRRVFRNTDFSPVGEEATNQMESARENCLQSGDSRSRTQESLSVSGQSSSFCVSPKDMLPPAPAATDVTKKRGRSKGTSCAFSNQHHSSPPLSATSSVCSPITEQQASCHYSIKMRPTVFFWAPIRHFSATLTQVLCVFSSVVRRMPGYNV